MPRARPAPAQSVQRQVLDECRAMANYAFAEGMKVPPDVVGNLGRLEPEVEADGPAKESTGASRDSSARQLSRIHNRLAELVAPAVPKTLLLLATERDKSGFWHFLGAVPLVRRLMGVAIFSMIGFVAVSLSEEVDGQGFDLLANSGLDLLLSELFLLTAASLGASFANLFEAQHYIRLGNFDPKYESSYWVRYVLGLMAGTILALLVPVEALGAPGGEGSRQSFDLVHQLGKPILALLGGFAAKAVYHILTRIVAALESLVRGDARTIAAAREQTSKGRLLEREVRFRMELTAKLTALEQRLSRTSDPEVLRSEINRMRYYLLTDEEDAEVPEALEPAPPPGRHEDE